MKIGLFIPCYVDALYPEVGKATYKLLCHLGLDVTYPERQTCCGQPMANAGFEPMAKHLANSFEEMFSGFDYVVAPSASCVSQTEAVGGVLAVAEDVGRGLVDGHCAGIGGGIGLLLANVQLKGLEFIVRHVDYLSLCTNSIVFVYKKSRSLRSQDSAPGKKILTCFGALPARAHSSGGGQSTAVRPEFCPVCIHSPTTEVCMKQVFPKQRHRGALLSLNFLPSLWIG